MSRSYQEQSKRGHEAFFSQLPRATVVFLVDLLEAAEVDVQDAGVDDAKSESRKTTTRLDVACPLQTEGTVRNVGSTYMAIPRKPLRGATPQMTPRMTAMICRSQ